MQDKGKMNNKIKTKIQSRIKKHFDRKDIECQSWGQNYENIDAPDISNLNSEWSF